MKFNILKTRKGKLEQKIKLELEKRVPSLINILDSVDDYERDNLETIDKLKRVKLIDTKKINGALKGCINAHGPITKMLIGSATKRIHGALLDSSPKPIESRKDNILNKLIKWIRK